MEWSQIPECTSSCERTLSKLGLVSRFPSPTKSRHRLAKVLVGDIYEVISCGAEELNTKGGIDKASIDTIITVQCLCSIPTPEIIIKELFPLLKPGGRWIVFEHVKTKYQKDFVGYWQSTCFASLP